MNTNQPPKASSSSAPASTSTSTSAFWTNIVKSALKLAFAGLLIYWMIHRGSLNLSLLSLLFKRPQFIVACMVAMFVVLYINNLRWLLLLKGQGFKSSIKETLPLTFIGLFFNFAMPGGVGGDVIKGYYLLQSHQTRRLEAATSILVDRLIGFFCMILFSIAALLWEPNLVFKSPHLTSISILILAIFAGFVVVFGLAFSRRVNNHPWLNLLFQKMPGGGRIRHLYSAMHAYRHSGKALIQALALSMVGQAFTVMIFVFVGLSMGADIPLNTYFLCIPVGLIGMALPIAPAGVGVGQAIFLFLFNWSLGNESQIGPNLVTAYQLVSFAWGLLGAFYYFRRKQPVLASPV